MKIVSFKDGMYGIRRFQWSTLNYVYKDLTVGNQSWFSMDSAFFYDCKSPSLDDVKNYFYNITDKGTPVNKELL
jgi:hypothetical protein